MYNHRFEVVMKSNLSTAQARSEFSEVINRVAFGKERVGINRRGKRIAAVVPIEDLELLEALENKMDLNEARAALKEAKAKGTKPLSKLKAELGLK
jgi:prevent-host-death family protein